MNSLDNSSSFRTVIVHEDAIAGLQAIGVLKQLAALLETKLGIDINPCLICNHAWQFEWLQNPELFEQAVAESIKADMIIISAQGHAELPACVRGWIESVLPRKDGGSTALVALLGGSRETHAASLPPARYLRQLAHQYDVDFLCNLDNQLRPVEAVLEPIHGRFEDDSAFFEEAIPGHSTQRGWGIND